MIKYSSILFDFDGTLTPSLPLWLKAYQYALEKFGVRLSDAEIVSACFYRDWQEIVDKFELSTAEDFASNVHTGLEIAFVDATLFDGVLALLDKCKQSGTNMAIVTSSTRKVVAKFLDSHDLTSYFGTIITGDETVNFKPHPEPVFAALENIGGTAQDSIFIGDSAVDMMAAHNAGMHKGLFYPFEHEPFVNLEDLKKHEPHFVFHSYDEISQHLGKAK